MQLFLELMEIFLGAGEAFLLWSWNLLNSSFSTALAGAAAGAYGAQIAAERDNVRRAKLEEIRATNAAISIAVSIANAFIALKAQHVKNLKESYDASFAKFHADRSAGAHVIELRFDLQALPITRVPIETLQDLLFHNLSVPGNTILLGVTIGNCVDGLADTIRARHDLISLFKKGQMSERQKAALYFGLRTDAGTDTSYQDAIKGIDALTDDCILFSVGLSKVLQAHGENLAKQFGKRAPKINKSDFSNPKKEGLLPSAELYPDWKWLTDIIYKTT